MSETLHARHAALLLHGLPPSVREQVLSKLPPVESSRLRPLLDELAALGIPRAGMPQLDTPGGSARTLTAVERAERLHPDDVLRGLSNCASATVALLLRAADWPWKREVLNRMSGVLRAEALGSGERAPIAPAVLRVLSECLCRDAAAPAVHRQLFGESSATRTENIRVDVTRFGTSPWPAQGKWATGTGGMGAGLGIGAYLRRLIPWTR